MEIGDWRLYYHRIFTAALDELEAGVAALAKKDPAGYRSHPKTQLLASIHKAVTQAVPANPKHPDFRLGQSPGSGYANWRRVKSGMPGRTRLFFRFAARFPTESTHC